MHFSFPRARTPLTPMLPIVKYQACEGPLLLWPDRQLWVGSGPVGIRQQCHSHRITSVRSAVLAVIYPAATASISSFHSGTSSVAQTTVIPTSWSPRCFLRILLFSSRYSGLAR